VNKGEKKGFRSYSNTNIISKARWEGKLQNIEDKEEEAIELKVEQ
jgi:hypothetical protein